MKNTISIVDIVLIDDGNLYNGGIPSFGNDDQKADQHIVEGTSGTSPEIWQRKEFQYYIIHYNMHNCKQVSIRVTNANHHLQHFIQLCPDYLYVEISTLGRCLKNLNT